MKLTKLRKLLDDVIASEGTNAVVQFSIGTPDEDERLYDIDDRIQLQPPEDDLDRPGAPVCIINLVPLNYIERELERGYSKLEEARLKWVKTLEDFKEVIDRGNIS